MIPQRPCCGCDDVRCGAVKVLCVLQHKAAQPWHQQPTLPQATFVPHPVNPVITEFRVRSSPEGSATLIRVTLSPSWCASSILGLIAGSEQLLVTTVWSHCTQPAGSTAVVKGPCVWHGAHVGGVGWQHLPQKRRSPVAHLLGKIKVLPRQLGMFGS
jgi:hypothetical protein